LKLLNPKKKKKNQLYDQQFDRVDYVIQSTNHVIRIKISKEMDHKWRERNRETNYRPEKTFETKCPVSTTWIMDVTIALKFEVT
jgi:hypothetical protein